MSTNKVNILKLESVSTMASVTNKVCAKFDRCIQGVPTVNNVERVMSASRGVDFLLVLEALYIRELKPKLSSNGQ